MVLDYSKWDALELSDDSDIEVHPNVDKRSFIRAKQNQIHQERQHRKHQIETLKYERIVNDGLLTRIDALLNALKAHTSSSESVNVDEVVFQSLIESAGDPAEDQPPSPPAGVHSKSEKQPTYSKMMAALVDQVKKHVNETKPENRLTGYIDEIGQHKTRVLDLQQQLLVKLAELEKLESSKITSESIHTGFNNSHISKSPLAGSTVELLNAPKRSHLPRSTSADSGAEADIEEGTAHDADNNNTNDDVAQPSSLGEGFAKIRAGDNAASLQYISAHPSVLAERETDGLLMMAFDAQMDGKGDFSRQCVHQALLLQYCRALGRDGVTIFFKRIASSTSDAKRVFLDDVNQTYARLKDRSAVLVRERAENKDGDDDDGPGVEQIQLHAVNPGQSISIRVPSPTDPGDATARTIFDTFPPGLQRALESAELEQVNKVLGKMSVDEAEEVVGKLSEGGMLSVEEGIIDTTTEEGKARFKDIEEGGWVAEEDDAEVVPGPGTEGDSNSNSKSGNKSKSTDHGEPGGSLVEGVD